jgi:hypothetical protein
MRHTEKITPSFCTGGVRIAVLGVSDPVRVGVHVGQRRLPSPWPRGRRPCAPAAQSGRPPRQGFQKLIFLWSRQGFQKFIFFIFRQGFQKLFFYVAAGFSKTNFFMHRQGFQKLLFLRYRSVPLCTLQFPAVLRIHEILVRIRIRGSMPLTNGTGCGSGSC